MATACRRLGAELPGIDVQIVGANNTAFLLRSVFRVVQRRHGTRAPLREMNRATTPGLLLLSGERLGEFSVLRPDGVVTAVRGGDNRRRR